MSENAQSSAPVGPKKFSYSKPIATREFSRSAAKRSSVMALGKIDHLQHYFAKEAKRVASASETRKDGPLKEEEEDDLLDVPTQPVVRRESAVEAFGQAEHLPDWKEMKAEVWQEIDQVCQRWNIVKHLKSNSVNSSAEMDRSRSNEPSTAQSSPEAEVKPSSSLVLDLIHLTTTAIRSVQRFVIALPTEQLSSNLSSLSLEIRQSISTASRPRTSLNTPQPRTSSLSAVKSDPASELRKACLDVLGTLKDMDLKYRKESSPNPQSTELPDSGPSALGKEVEEGHLYREVTLAELDVEKEQVKKWIQIVDQTLFESVPKSRRKSDASEKLDLPDWVADFDDPLQQAHLLILHHIPSELLVHLQPASDHGAFLDSLSNGQLLCLAFNIVVRQSNRPWGFIPAEEIHDLFSIEGNSDKRRAASEMSDGGTARVGLTFRRLENLRVFVAAIKLRYSIHLRNERGAQSREGENFDVKVISRKDAEWETMLALAVSKWTQAVVKEKRNEQ